MPKHTETHTFSLHTHTHKLFYSLALSLHNMEVWEELVECRIFRRTVLFWSPAVRRLQSFYFIEHTLQFLAPDFPFLFPRSYHLPRGVVWVLSITTPYLYSSNNQTTVQAEKQAHIKHLMTDICRFSSFFFGRHTLDTKNMITMSVSRGYIRIDIYINGHEDKDFLFLSICRIVVYTFAHRKEWQVSVCILVTIPQGICCLTNLYKNTHTYTALYRNR